MRYVWKLWWSDPEEMITLQKNAKSKQKSKVNKNPCVLLTVDMPLTVTI